ncbi:hypothetical protein [Buttiauxella izardii]|nr:hypothetical protein [Buttiauxella izardii]
MCKKTQKIYFPLHFLRVIFRWCFLHKLIERDFMSGIRELSFDEVALVNGGSRNGQDAGERSNYGKSCASRVTHDAMRGGIAGGYAGAIVGGINGIVGGPEGVVAGAFTGFARGAIRGAIVDGYRSYNQNCGGNGNGNGNAAGSAHCSGGVGGTCSR